MEKIIMNNYIRMFDLLEIENKIELLARLSDNVNKTFRKPKKDKNELLESISGAWADIDDDIVDDIYNSRTFSSREIDLDNLDE